MEGPRWLVHSAKVSTLVFTHACVHLHSSSRMASVRQGGVARCISSGAHTHNQASPLHATCVYAWVVEQPLRIRYLVSACCFSIEHCALPSPAHACAVGHKHACTRARAHTHPCMHAHTHARTYSCGMFIPIVLAAFCQPWLPALKPGGRARKYLHIASQVCPTGLKLVPTTRYKAHRGT